MIAININKANQEVGLSLIKKTSRSDTDRLPLGSSDTSDLSDCRSRILGFDRRALLSREKEIRPVVWTLRKRNVKKWRHEHTSSDF